MVWKNLTGLHRALTSTSSNTFGMNWNADCVRDLITQHQCWTSLMLLWLNGSKSLQQVLVESLKPEEWRLQINAHGFGMRWSLITYGYKRSGVHILLAMKCILFVFQLLPLPLKRSLLSLLASVLQCLLISSGVMEHKQPGEEARLRVEGGVLFPW